MSLVVGVVATGIIWWTGSKKEQHWAALRNQSDKETSLANERAASAIERTAELDRQAAQAKLETERLREQLSWRELTAYQSQRLREFFQSQAVIFDGIALKFSFQNNPEARELANQIYRIMFAAGLHPNEGVQGAQYMDNDFYGSKIKGKANSAQVKSLQDGLRIIGLDPLFENAEQLEVIIGLKHPPKLK